MRPDPDPLLVAGLRVALLLAVFALSLFPLTSYDVWLHLGIGQRIVERGEIPTTGWGSRLCHDREWVAHEWGFQAIFYGIHSWGGERALLLLRAIIATAATAILLWALSEAGAGPYAACAAATAAGAVSFSQLFWPARPQIVTQLFLPLLLALLLRGRAGKRRLLFGIPILMAVWANLHGGYIIGPATVLLFLIGDLLEGVFGRPGDAGWRKTLGLVLVASVVACMATPYTYRTLVYPFVYYFGEPITVGNVEWGATMLREFPLFEALAVLTLISVVVARPGPYPLEILLALSFFHLSIVSVRHVPLSAAVLGVVLGASWTRWWKTEPLSFPSAVGGVAAAVRARPALRGGLTLAVMAISLCSICLSETPPWWFRGSRWHRGRPLPEMAVHYLRETGMTRGIFNQYEWGGYLIYQFPGEEIVSIDGRNDLYGAAHNRKYIEAMEGIPTWRQTFEEWGVEIALISKGPQGWGLRFVLNADPEWDLAFEGRAALVFVRRDRR